MKVSWLIFIILFCSGCAKMFACSTEASYITRVDGSREVTYSSCKEQVGLDAQIDPKTGAVHVKVDRASTQEAVMLKMVEMMQSLLPIIEKAAMAGGS